MCTNPFQATQLLEHLKKDIQYLSEKQSQALQTAVYFGFSREEKDQYDERLDRIGKLRRELALMRVNARP